MRWTTLNLRYKNGSLVDKVRSQKKYKDVEVYYHKHNMFASYALGNEKNYSKRRLNISLNNPQFEEMNEDQIIISGVETVNYISYYQQWILTR